jgi:hypothetical protein
MIFFCGAWLNADVQGLSGNGVMTVSPGDMLTMRYADEMPEGERISTVVVARIGVLKTKPSNVVAVGDPVQVTVMDADLSLLPNVLQGSYVTAIAVFSASSRSVVQLAESSPKSGIFTGQLLTCLSCDTAATLKVEQGAVVTLDYIDIFAPFTANTVSASFVIASSASLLISPLTVAAGEALTILLTDKDARFSFTELPISIFKVPSPDGETVRILLPALQLRGTVVLVQDALTFALDDEASAVDGTYIGGLIEILGQTCAVTDYRGASRLISVSCPSVNLVQLGTQYLLRRWGQYGGTVQTVKRIGTKPLPTSPGSSTMAILHVDPAQALKFVYEDGSPADTVLQVAMISEPSGINSYPAVEANKPALWVELADPNLDHNAALPARLTVLVANQRSGETEAATLMEVGANVGLFRTWLPLVNSDSTGQDNDGMLSGLSGDPLVVRYDEPLPVGMRRMALELRFASTLDMPLPDFALGESILVTVFDGDLDIDRAAPDVVSTLAYLSIQGGDHEPLLLTENGPRTGIFTAMCPTKRLLYQPGCTQPDPSLCTREQPTIANGVLEADLDAAVFFGYQEQHPPGLRNLTSVARGRPTLTAAVIGPSREGRSLVDFLLANRPAIRVSMFSPALASSPGIIIPRVLRVISSVGAEGPDGQAAALVSNGMRMSPPVGNGWGGGEIEEALALSNVAVGFYEVRNRP